MSRAAAAALLLAAVPAAAQDRPPASATLADPAVRTAAAALVPLLDGQGDYDAYFAPSFRAAIPATQFAAVTAQLKAGLGRPVAIDTLAATGAFAATVTVRYERGTASIRLALDPGPPHQVTGLVVTGTAIAGDTWERLGSDVRALPGTAALGVWALDGPAPRPLLAIAPDTAMPLGSAFKLWVLAEAARQVAAGRRRWADVVPLGAPSLPSGVTQGWPRGTPMTLQSLATLMVSISDNTATDTLVTVLGRDAVDAQARASGGSTPVLTTHEAFVLKGDPALAARWRAAATVAAKRALLAGADRRPLDPGLFGAAPLATDSVEWFASGRATAGLLARLKAMPAPVRDILSVNHGANPATTARFAYLGFKGGSEPGVLSLNFLARTRDGRWFAVTAAWHRTDAGVEEATLLQLATRALGLVAATDR